MNAVFWLIDKKGIIHQFLVFSALSPIAGVFVLGNSVYRGISLSKYHVARQISRSRENPFFK